ncbi:EamA family transporter [Endozoicomonas numazuensis]|uniref:Uncharacterized protein n=1 Tax=Endozoicomonas numazuensis TaxID=1137799 RepID=A0A081N000_9GAMM|nr:EamA family transporter [Endozoicomonas numazuensis]KEQ11773.1 hypothetical protein GZ78_28390 [Endozoicomonas numazuensis]
MSSLHSPLTYAMIAAVGNALLAFGVKETTNTINPFIYIVFVTIFCTIFSFAASLFIENPEYLLSFKKSYVWASISGLGMAIAWLGVTILYMNFGASYYTLYAVLSILTTSIIVGIIIFRESLNLWHILASIAALAAIFLFHLGSRAGR